jgi:hypothetical protein
MSTHEYALVGGFNRALIGRYLGTLAAIVSGVIVFLLLASVDLAHRLGMSASLPPTVLSLASGMTVYAVLYWIFSRHAWRWRFLSRALGVPNLAGEWRCIGKTLNDDGTARFNWHGTVTITQNWDKIRVRLKTAQSGSHSIAAALLCDAENHTLLYNYKNDPRIGETHLHSHRGFAELTFAKDGQTAEGEYVNGYGRKTFGSMQLERA